MITLTQLNFFLRIHICWLFYICLMQLYSFCATIFLQFKGSTPSVCWNKIYKRIRKVKISSPDCEAEVESERGFESGSDMFGFSHPEVSKLLKVCHMINAAVFFTCDYNYVMVLGYKYYIQELV